MKYMTIKKHATLLLSLLFLLYGNERLSAQQSPDSTFFGLQNCIDYALQHQPAVQQALIDQEITEKDIQVQLADWFPQINANATYNYNLKIPTSVANFNGQQTTIKQGLNNASGVSVQADQNIYSNDLFLASKAAKYQRKQIGEQTKGVLINTVTSVSKAFYDILLSKEQLNILDEDILRLEKQFHDAYAQYESGLVDKIDYKRATISLNSSKAQRKTIAENLKYKYARLKELMGLAPGRDIGLTFNDENLESDILLDTNQVVNYESRIEFQQLQTRKQLLGLNTSYYQYGFLPKLSGFINYNWNYFDDQFSELYKQSFPSSQVGLKLTLPVFTGFKRIQNLRKAKLQERRIDLDIQDVRSQINTEYQLAMGSYKSNLNDWRTQQENEELAKDVYETVKLQYDEGIKSYLELITSETDLRTAQLNYLNALYNLLSSKYDVQKALGTINVNP